MPVETQNEFTATPPAYSIAGQAVPVTLAVQGSPSGLIDIAATVTGPGTVTYPEFPPFISNTTRTGILFMQFSLPGAYTVTWTGNGPSTPTVINVLPAMTVVMSAAVTGLAAKITADVYGGVPPYSYEYAAETAGLIFDDNHVASPLASVPGYGSYSVLVNVNDSLDYEASATIEIPFTESGSTALNFFSGFYFGADAQAPGYFYRYLTEAGQPAPVSPVAAPFVPVLPGGGVSVKPNDDTIYLFRRSVVVTIAASGMTAFYSLDGSAPDPTSQSQRYLRPFTLDRSSVLRVVFLDGARQLQATAAFINVLP